MGRVPSLSNLVHLRVEQLLDLRQFPGTEQTHRIGAVTLPTVQSAFLSISIAGEFTVM